MHERFLKFLKEKKLLKKGDKVLLAVSGGIDSMVMAHLFKSIGIETGIAHCNFCLRGSESEGDEEFVKQFSIKHGIPFFSIRFDTMQYARLKKISIEMAARELRYEWFGKISNENGYDAIAIAHNMNDNAETLLLNLSRGTGIAGLTGLKASSGRIIRPLLFATRSQIEEYGRINNIDYREDRTNSDIKYTRNKIRHFIIPVLKEINPSIEDTIYCTAERLTAANNLIAGTIESIRNRSSFIEGNNRIFRIDTLHDVLDNETAVFELFRPYGINSTGASDLVKVINGRTGGQILTPTHRILKNRNELIVAPVEKCDIEEYRIEDPDEFKNLTFIRSAEVFERYYEMKIPGSPEIAFLDYRKLKFPLIVRKWKKGDSFFPLGMNRKKKLSDYFIDKKVPLIKKEKILIIESAGEIVWIIGERIDDRYKITPSTLTILRLEADLSGNL